uniref:beta-lactoglobulin-1-like n=1 Tax=Callithrix jacchus TaxID=9483 RepID=UPI00159E3E96|nr:beta-lactoglobulin-1-like [Callithrix jacchus]
MQLTVELSPLSALWAQGTQVAPSPAKKSSEPPTAAAMQCLLLTLGMALVCSIQASDIPQTEQDLEVPKVLAGWLPLCPPGCVPRLGGLIQADAQQPGWAGRAVSLGPFPECSLWPRTGFTNTPTAVQLLREHHKCAERAILAQKTEDPAVFRADSRTLGADDKVMEEFIHFLKTLPVHMRIFPDVTQAEERCRI